MVAAPMKFVSTRDTADAPREFTFLEAVAMGLAEDGGLLVPRAVPKVSAAEQARWQGMAYPELAFEVMRLYAGDIPEADLRGLATAACQNFDTPANVVELSTVAGEDDMQILELFHGPTLAFKDIALQFLGQLFGYMLERGTVSKITVVCATSGDTGSSAIAGVKDIPAVKCCVLFPDGKTSPTQELQMTTIVRDNIRCVGVEDSNFDQCQTMVKALFSDLVFKKEHNLMAVNSINFARILAQIVYFVYAALRVTAKSADGGGDDKPARFSVPTGNFGDVLAGHYARQMGMPMARLHVAVNTNDILHRFFMHGEYRMCSVTPTLSPSMDIQMSSNFERLMHGCLGAQRVAELMAQLKREGAFAVSAEERALFEAHVTSSCTDEARTVQVIADFHARHGVLVDPHTAVAVDGMLRLRTSSGSSGGSRDVALSTAHMGKFIESLAGKVPESVMHAAADAQPQALSSLVGLPTAKLTAKADEAEIRRIVADLSGA